MTTNSKINQIVSALPNLTETMKYIVTSQITRMAIQIYYDGMREGFNKDDVDDCVQWDEYVNTETLHS